MLQIKTNQALLLSWMGQVRVTMAEVETMKNQRLVN